MYNVGGTMTCTKLAGSYNHEFTDAKTYSEWGTDFLKYDFCNNPLVKMPLDPTTGESVNTSFQETVLDTMAKEAPVVRKIVVKKMKDGVATEIKTVEIGSSNTTISDGAQLDFGYGADTPCLGMLDSNDKDVYKRQIMRWYILNGKQAERKGYRQWNLIMAEPCPVGSC